MSTFKVFDFATKKNLILIVITSILFLFIVGFIYYLAEEKALKEEKHKELSTVSKIKLQQIIDWRRERIYEAEFFAKIDRLIKATQSLLNNVNDSEVKGYLQELLYPAKASHGYENIFITDIKSEILFTLDSIYNRTDSITALNISKVIKTDSLLFEDFHFCTTHNKIHLDIIAPIKDYENKTIAAIVFRVDPSDYFYPMIQRWPTYSKTAETVLLRNEGKQLRVLNHLRNKSNLKILFTIPITETKYVAVKGALGQKGIIEGKDYGNTDVIADVNLVPGTNWFIVTKTAKNEIYSELLFRTGAATLVALFVLLLIISTAFYFYKTRHNFIYKDLFLKEKELNEYQKRTKAITDATHDAIIMIDANGNVSFWNPAAEKILGYKANEIIEKNLHNLLAPSHYLAQHQQAFNKFILTGEGNAIGRILELNAIKKNGEEISIELALSAIKNNDEWHAVGIIRDISERKKAEEKLKESEEKFRKAFDTTTDSLVISRLSDGLLINVNSGFCKITGFSKEETAGKTIFDLEIWYDTKDREKVIQSLMENGAVDNYEAKFKSKDGSIIYGLVSLSLIHINDEPHLISITRNITERKKNEAALKESEELFRHSFNYSAAGMCMIGIDGKVQKINNTFTKIFGYTETEIADYHFYDITYPDDISIGNSRFSKMLNGEINNAEFEKRYFTKDKKIVYAHVTTSLIRDSKNNPQFFISQIIDITERKTMEDALKQSEEKYRTMITQMQLGVAVHEIICDDNGTPVDYRFIDVNASFEKLTGLKKENIIGKRVMEVLPETERLLIEKYGYVALTGVPQQFENYSKELNKYYSVVAYRPHPMHFAVIIDDITERKLAETELIDSMNEISRFNNLMVGREEKMIELKKEINKLLEESGKEKKYGVVEE